MELATAIGASPAHVINAVENGWRCLGHTIEQRGVGYDEASALGYDGRTRRLFRVERWAEELSRLRELRADLSVRLGEVDATIEQLENLEAILRRPEAPPPLPFIAGSITQTACRLTGVQKSTR